MHTRWAVFDNERRAPSWMERAIIVAACLLLAPSGLPSSLSVRINCRLFLAAVRAAIKEPKALQQVVGEAKQCYGISKMALTICTNTYSLSIRTHSLSIHTFISFAPICEAPGISGLSGSKQKAFLRSWMLCQLFESCLKATWQEIALAVDFTAKSN